MYRFLYSKRNIIIIIGLAETFGNGYKDDYTIKLENLLREGRKLGFKFIFASQSFEDGIRGLTDSAKKQIQMRLALKNTREEIFSTLQLGASERTEKIEGWVASLPPYKTLIKTLEKDNKGMDVSNVDKVNNLKIEQIDIENYMKKLNDSFYTVVQYDGQPLSYVNKKSLIFAIDTPKSYLSQVEVFEKNKEKLWDNDDYDEDDIVLYPGSSKGFDGVNPVLIHRDACENILFAGGDAPSMTSTLMTIMDECARQDVKISIWTDARNIIYRKYGKRLFDSSIVFKGIDEICKEVCRLKASKKNVNDKDEIIILLGCRNLFDEFELYDEDEERYSKLGTGSNATVSDWSDIDAEFAEVAEMLKTVVSNPDMRESINEQISMNNSQVKESTDDVEDKTYDATNDIKMLLKRGAKDGKHFIVCFDNVSDYSSTRLDSKLFKHKLLLSMNRDFEYAVNESDVQKLDYKDVMYAGQKVRTIYTIMLHKDIPFAGYRIAEGGEVVIIEE